MFLIRFRFLMMLGALAAGTSGLFSQEEPKLGEQEMRQFLLKADIIKERNTAYDRN
jgi:hypothetical protein